MGNVSYPEKMAVLMEIKRVPQRRVKMFFCEALAVLNGR